MATTAQTGPRPPRGPLRLVAVLLVALVVAGRAVDWFVDALWFQELGALQVWTTGVRQNALIGTFAFVVAFAVLGFAVLRVLRRGPALRFGRDGEVRIVPADRRFRPVVLAAVGVVALFFAAELGSHWLELRLALERVPYGVREPIFGRDAADYVFVLPAAVRIVNWLIALVVLALGATGALEALFASTTGARTLTAAAWRGLGAWTAALFALIGMRIGLEQFSVLYSPHGTLYGAGYTDVHARLPAFRILAVAAFVVAAAVAAGAWRGRVRVAAMAVGAWLVIAILGLGLVPTAMQKLFVEPTELAKEKPFLEAAIHLTRAAYDLDAIEARPFQVDKSLDAAGLAQHADLLDNVRLWDWKPLLATYGQIQEIRLYYNFGDVDIDRYTVGGRTRQVMLSARELAYDQLPEGARTWVNLHLKYTHGYGLCMSPVTHVTREGLPDLWVRDIPPVSSIDLPLERPEIYYGEQTSVFALVGTGTDEFDYPTGESNQLVRYAGKGGIPVGSAARRLLFAWALQSREMLFTSYLKPESRLLLRRSLRARAPHIAPFLRYDHDPYLVVADGRCVWIQDAYTASDRFPNSFRSGDLNTIRNAVKITVDAYDGTTRFYSADSKDPLLRAYSAIFPELFLPLDQMPAALRAHLRFPEDLFDIQAHVLATYHMQDPQVFYNREDLWAAPLERSSGREVTLDPYYAMVQVEPGGAAEFVLMQPFTPAGKDNMIACLVARCDGEHRGERYVALYPKQELIYGPRQIEARIDQDGAISQLLTLWSQHGSNVLRGTLLVMPIGQALLYVEPLYLQAENGGLPELKRVIVAHGDRIEIGENLQDALSRLVVGADASFQAAEPAVPGAAPPSAPHAGGPDPGRALGLLQDAEAALRNGDWVAHGRAMQELRQFLQNASGAPPRP